VRKELKNYTRQTIACWNEAAERHKAINHNLSLHVKEPTFNHLNPDFDELINSTTLKNKSVVQICCNNGIDLISIKKKGAGYCLGIDGAQAFIDQARELSISAALNDLEFLCSDIYDLPETLNGRFDIVILTVGVINWMPDLSTFMQVCTQVLKQDGLILMEEIHPILGMYEEGSPSYLDASYFEKEPYKDEAGLDYFTNKKYQAKPNFWFQHTLSDLFMAALSAGLTLKFFKELDYNVGNFCADLEHIDANPPLGMNVVWAK
jgi:SAM-dependent methyltransferase